MRRYMIVANQTLAAGALLAKVRALHGAGPCTFYVVVPATPPPDHPWTEGETQRVASERLDRCLTWLREMGIEADGEVGDAHPVDAIKDVMLRGEVFDEIVLSTLRPGLSRWLKWDLISRVEGFGIPVQHVIGDVERVSPR